jgi:gag-polypeptide of LTR copia-type
LIHGYDLGRFLGSPPPATTRRTTNGIVEINPDYLPWHCQDQLLLGWLRSSLTEILLARVVSTTNTKELWQSLEEYYASTSHACLHELKRQIQTASKGDSTCSEYLLRLRRVADRLSFIGAPLPEDELVSATINGLGIEYNSIIVVVSTAQCSGTFNFSDLQGLLLSHEALLKS